MRILVVSPWTVYPPVNGSAVRVFNLMRHLSATHEIRQFSQPRLRQPGDLREPLIRVAPSYCEYRWRNLASRLAAEWCRRSWIYQHVYSGELLRLFRPRVLLDWLAWCDVCVVEFPWQFHFCRAALPTKPVVLSTHNVEVDTRISNAGAAGIPTDRSRWLARVRRLEEEAVAAADLVLAVSPDDRNAFVERFGAPCERVVEVPNGSDTAAFAPVDPGRRPELRRMLGLPDRPTAVFVAAGPKIPDRFGLAWFERLARLLPDVTFVVVGGVIERPRVDGNVVATGFVDDLCPYLHAADLAVAPIEYGGGTKIKVWDALAAGLPTVVFPETLHGTALADGEHLLVAAKSDAALAGAARRLLDDAALAARLGAAGRAFVVAHHDWGRIARDLSATLIELGRQS